MNDLDEAVRLRAYEIWERNGHPDGEHESHWTQALTELGLRKPSQQPDGATVDPADMQSEMARGPVEVSGMTESFNQHAEREERRDLPGSESDKQTIQRDAEGQFAPSIADRRSNGVASAIPTKVTGQEDATLYKADEKKAPKPGFDESEQTNNRD